MTLIRIATSLGPIDRKNVYQSDVNYYPTMSEDELTAIRRKKLREFQNKLATKGNQSAAPSANDFLNKIFTGRAWEVFNSASQQFPNAMGRVKDVLVRLASSGRLTEVTGEELFVFLRKLGLGVKLNTKISYASHGQLKSLEEKVKEEIQKN